MNKQYLAPQNYFPARYPKRNIVLHHTVSSTAQSAWRWWNMRPDRVATAYIVDKDGTVTECFDPRFWAHHLGLKRPDNVELNRRSVGIELVNEGPLFPDLGGYRDIYNKEYQGEVYAQAWRGFHHWATYTEAQYTSLNALLPELLERFGLPPTMCVHRNFDMAVPSQYTIYHHANVRADKTDLSPAFDFSKIAL